MCINISNRKQCAKQGVNAQKKTFIGVSWAAARLIIARICDVLQNPVSVDTMPTRVETEPVHTIREPDRDIVFMARSDLLDLAVIPPLPDTGATRVPYATVVSNLRM